MVGLDVGGGGGRTRRYRISTRVVRAPTAMSLMRREEGIVCCHAVWVELWRFGAGWCSDALRCGGLSVEGVEVFLLKVLG